MPSDFITKQTRTNCMHPGFVGGTTSLFKGLQVGRIGIRGKLYSTRRRQLWWPPLWSGKEVSQGQAKDFGRLGTLWKGKIVNSGQHIFFYFARAILFHLYINFLVGSWQFVNKVGGLSKVCPSAVKTREDQTVATNGQQASMRNDIRAIFNLILWADNMFWLLANDDIPTSTRSKYAASMTSWLNVSREKNISWRSKKPAGPRVGKYGKWSEECPGMPGMFLFTLFVTSITPQLLPPSSPPPSSTSPGLLQAKPSENPSWPIARKTTFRSLTDEGRWGQICRFGCSCSSSRLQGGGAVTIALSLPSTAVGLDGSCFPLICSQEHSIEHFNFNTSTDLQPGALILTILLFRSTVLNWILQLWEQEVA